MTSAPVFKSAGVLPVRYNETSKRVEVLLAFEENWGSRRCLFHERPRGCRDGVECEFLHISGPVLNGNEIEMPRLNFLGGKREAYENHSTQTAAREFFEETNELVSLEEATAFVTGQAAQCCRLFGAYDLYINWLPENLHHNIVEAYERLPRNPPLACAFHLYWIPVQSLLHTIKEKDTVGFYIHDSDNGGGDIPISHLIWCFCTKTWPCSHPLVVL